MCQGQALTRRSIVSTNTKGMMIAPGTTIKHTIRQWARKLNARLAGMMPPLTCINTMRICPPAPLGAIRLRGAGVFNGSSVNDCPSSPPVLLSWNVSEVFSMLEVSEMLAASQTD